jgi:hypothetical protein
MTDEITIEKILERGFVKDFYMHYELLVNGKYISVFKGNHSCKIDIDSHNPKSSFHPVTTMAQIDEAIAKNKKR